MLKLDGWGNARDVDKVWKATLQHRADRVIATPEHEKTLALSDVRAAVDALVKARRSSAVGASSSAASQWTNCNLPMQTQDAFAPFKGTSQRLERPEEQEETGAPETDVSEGLVAAAVGRDAGVSDEVWEELQGAKAEAEACEAQAERRCEALRCEAEAEGKRIRRELKEREREEALRQAQEELQARLEAERRRREAEEERRREELRKAQAVQEKLRQISPCPAGFAWFKCGGGWRCGGGSHFVSDAQLNAQFKF